MRARVEKVDVLGWNNSLKKSKSFEWKVYLLLFVINSKKLSSHMAQISEDIHSTNHKIHSYDQTGKMIVNLGSKKDENNNKYSPQLPCLHN